jgi:hypothetical protein
MAKSHRPAGKPHSNSKSLFDFDDFISPPDAFGGGAGS